MVPTVLDLLDLPVPEDLDGQSLDGLLTEGELGPRESLFGETTWHERYAPMRALRTERYKYVRNFWKQQRVHLPADVFGSSAERAVREEYYVTERPREELYDLEADPNERENLAASVGVFDPPDAPAGQFGAPGAGPDSGPEYADVLESLRGRLREWMEATDDPLRDGPVTRPGTGGWPEAE